MVTFGWFACLCLTTLHSGTDLIGVLFVLGISLSWAVFLHFNNFVSFIVFPFYPYSLLVMLGGLAGICHGVLHLSTDLLWVYTTIIWSLIWYIPPIVMPMFSLAFAIEVADRCSQMAWSC